MGDLQARRENSRGPGQIFPGGLMTLFLSYIDPTRPKLDCKNYLTKLKNLLNFRLSLSSWGPIEARGNLLPMPPPPISAAIFKLLLFVHKAHWNGFLDTFFPFKSRYKFLAKFLAKYRAKFLASRVWDQPKCPFQCAILWICLLFLCKKLSESWQGFASAMAASAYPQHV
jgi:hypothetical protein